MSSLSFLIPGDPRGKGRPRFSSGKGFVRTYTDDRTAAYENLAALAAKDALDGRAPFDVAVSVYLRAQYRIPKSTSKALRARMLDGEVQPTKLPDLDNVLKAVLDGCNRVAFTDDALVTSIRAVKVYSESPGVFVTITPSTDA